MTTPKSTATPAPEPSAAGLPIAFFVLAEAALTSGGHDPGVPKRLARAMPFVTPILTPNNLIGRRDDLVEAALKYTRSKRGPETATEDCGPIMDAVELGIVAGFLLAQLLEGRDVSPDRPLEGGAR